MPPVGRISKTFQSHGEIEVSIESRSARGIDTEAFRLPRLSTEAEVGSVSLSKLTWLSRYLRRSNRIAGGVRGRGCKRADLRRGNRVARGDCVGPVSYTHLTLPTKRIV